MLKFLKNLFAGSPKVDYQTLVNEGAKIVDVRMQAEYKSGHLKNSINIPVDGLKNQLGKFKKDAPIIVCCASGMRSAGARSIMKQNGFTKVYNGGSWTGLQRQLQSPN